MRDWKHVLGGALLVTGTSIGAGMLALPVITGLGGFFPAIIAFLLVWGVLTATGLLLLEVCLTFPLETNLISLSKTYLGAKGKIFTWIVYLFLFYTLIVAYLSKGGELVHLISGGALSLPLSITLVLGGLGVFIFWGTYAVDRINHVLVFGLIISFSAFILLGWSHVEWEKLTYVNVPASLLGIPIILISFGYQGIVPSLTTYLKRDPKKVRLSIILGTTIALVVYLIWELLILGIIPVEGQWGLIEAKKNGDAAIGPLKFFTNAHNIYAIGQFFSFFAVTSSFMGVSLGLFDFLADGLKLKKIGTQKILIALFTFIPPWIITMTYPGLFLKALQYAGGIGGNLLLVFLPTLLVWKVRYGKNKNHSLVPRQLFGGKTMLVFIFLFSLLTIVLELVEEFFRV